MGPEDLPEEKMSTHSRILAWRIPWTEEPGRYIVHGVSESDMTKGLTLSSGLNNRNLLSQSSGGKKSEIKMLAGLCSLQRHEGRICSGPLSYLLVVCVNSSVVSVCNPMDYSPSGSSVHGILQARIRE